MQKNCKTCKKDFEIRKEDLVFYEQIQVQTPNHCPDCRVMRRLAYRNERTLYKRVCDLCKKSIISIYPENTKFPVYCHPCWWSDSWTAEQYKMDYDRSRPFMEQFAELKNKVPRVALLSLNSVNSDYVNNGGDNKNCYLVFAADSNEDCSYSRLIMKDKFVFDSISTYESELGYELIDCKSCFKCMYSERLQECSDVLFSYDMRNCQNCLFSTNGRNWNYYIYNKKLTKEEFEKKKEEIFASRASIEQAKKEYEDIKTKAIIKYAQSVKCNNATGDYMYNCHNGVRLFDVRNSKDSSYIADAEDPLDCQDCNNVYYKPERCYNIMSTLQSNNCIACAFPMYCNEVEYSDSCYHCTSCFGCVGLDKKQFHILNKEYSKEEYEKIKGEIVEEMKKEGIYGDFLPPELSPFGFNETLGIEYYPISEKEAGGKGFNWQNIQTGTFGKETLTEFPEIGEVNEGILKEVLVCSDCKKNFRLTKAELDFYKRMNIPIPHKDFECRHQDRMSKRNPRKLWRRTCMCELKNHQHNGKCPNEFETSYSPNRGEVVYCETCYQQEVS